MRGSPKRAISIYLLVAEWISRVWSSGLKLSISGGL